MYIPLGQHINVTSIRRKSQWEVKGSHSCTFVALRSACWEKCFPIPGWKLQWTNKRSLGKEIGICSCRGVEIIKKKKKNQTCLGCRTERDYHSWSGKMGAWQEGWSRNRAEDRLETGRQDKLQCQVLGSWLLWNTPTHHWQNLLRWGTICHKYILTLLRTWLCYLKSHICFSFVPAAINNLVFSESKVFHYSPCTLQGAADTDTTTSHCMFQLCLSGQQDFWNNQLKWIMSQCV